MSVRVPRKPWSAPSNVGADVLVVSIVAAWTDAERLVMRIEAAKAARDELFFIELVS